MESNLKATLPPADYWNRHAEAWGDIAEAHHEYHVGSVASEEFFSDLADAAKYLTEVHFN